MSDTRTADLFAEPGDAQPNTRKVRVSVGGGGRGGALGEPLGHPSDAGDDAIANYTINFGPQNPAAHGVLRLIMDH
ncbi:MAG: hypothetical protein ACJ8EI_05025, partial [Sphingomicrobium sp.]